MILSNLQRICRTQREMKITKLLLESQNKVTSKNANLVAEFLQLNQRMGHIPFQKLRIMAQKNIIPSKKIC